MTNLRNGQVEEQEDSKSTHDGNPSSVPIVLSKLPEVLCQKNVVFCVQVGTESNFFTAQCLFLEGDRLIVIVDPALIFPGGRRPPGVVEDRGISGRLHPCSSEASNLGGYLESVNGRPKFRK